MPEPLATIVDHLDGLGAELPEFLATVDLAEVLDFDPHVVGSPARRTRLPIQRDRVTTKGGRTRQIRGYLTADLLAAAAAVRECDTADPPASDGSP